MRDLKMDRPTPLKRTSRTSLGEQFGSILVEVGFACVVVFIVAALAVAALWFGTFVPTGPKASAVAESFYALVPSSAGLRVCQLVVTIAVCALVWRSLVKTADTGQWKGSRRQSMLAGIATIPTFFALEVAPRLLPFAALIVVVLLLGILVTSTAWLLIQRSVRPSVERPTIAERKDRNGN